MTSVPLPVSSIITAHNTPCLSRTAVESIRAQSSLPDEIVVIDDGSTDRTPAIVKKLGADFRYIFQPNRDEASARNRGVAAASGKNIAFLAADDAWPSNRLERLLQPSRPDEIENCLRSGVGCRT